MADITTTWGLDARDFARQAQGVERVAERAAAKAEREWKKTQKGFKEAADALLGVGAAGVAVAFAKDAMAAYHKSVGDAEGATSDLDRAVQDLKVSLGRDLSMAVDGGGGFIGGLINGLSSARELLTDIIANVGQTASALAHWDYSRYSSQGDIRSSAMADEDAKRLAAAQRERSGRMGGILSAERAAAGGIGAADDVARLDEAARHKQALAEAGAKKEKDARDMAVEDENRLHAAKMRGFDRAARERAYDEETARQLAELEVKRWRVAELRMNKNEEGALRLEKELDAEKMLLQITRDRSLTQDQKNERASRIDRSLIGREVAIEEARRKAATAHRDAVEKIGDEQKQASIQRMRIDGHQTEAELAEIRLGFETKIRDALRDQALSVDEQRRAAEMLAGSRDSVLRAAANELLERAQGEYRQAMAARSFRGVEAGLGYRASGVLGPAGTTESAYMAGGGRTELEKKADLLNKAMEAVNRTLEEINRKTPSRPVGAVG